jgi:hypothetical protein
MIGGCRSRRDTDEKYASGTFLKRETTDDSNFSFGSGWKLLENLQNQERTFSVANGECLSHFDLTQ